MEQQQVPEQQEQQNQQEPVFLGMSDDEEPMARYWIPGGLR